MFRIGSVARIGEGRYHVIIIGPPPQSGKLAFTRETRMGLREVWEAAQDWCDDRNIDVGFYKTKRKFGPTGKYKARSTVVFRGMEYGRKND